MACTETAQWTWCYHARVQISTSVKTIKIGYLLCLLAAIGIAVYLLAIHNQDERMWAWLALPALAALYLMLRHIRRRMVKLTILDDRLRYEAGFLSKTTRTMELSKVQDVRVDQTVGQRMLNIGNLSLGDGGRIQPDRHALRRPAARSRRPDSGIIAWTPPGRVNAPQASFFLLARIERDLVQARDRYIRSEAQWFHFCRGPVAPADLVAKRLGAGRVPGV